MKPNYHRRKARRSAVGFALAFTMAVATLWIASLAVELRSFSASPQPAPAQLTSAPTAPCGATRDDAAQCRPSRAEAERRL